MNDRNLDMEILDFLKKENIGKTIYKNAVVNSTNKKNRRKKAQMRKRAIRTTVIAGTSYGMAFLSMFGVEQVKGKDVIINNFNKYVNEYGIKKADIKNDIAYIDGVEISLDSIINDIINDARYGGMSDAEINLGLSDLVGKSLANQYLNVSIDEKVGVKTKAYHEWKASLYYLDDNNRGVSR